jgi:hypothetical protein
MTDATFNISFVPFKTEQFGLVWTSTSADVRPTFSLENVSSPAVGDELHFYFDGVDYSATMTNDETYKLKIAFPEIPEILNGTYEAYAEWHQGATVTTSNTVSVTIDSPDTIPVISGTPTISRTGNTFTVVPTTTTGRPLPTRTYQWYRDASAISGQTGTTYTYSSPADEDTTITCRQIETNSEGSDEAASNGIYVPLDPWVASTAQPAIVDKALSSSTHTFTSVDFVAGLGIVMVGQNVPGRTITGVTVNGNACTLVVADGATHYASMWKVTVATPGSYDVVVTASAALALVGILTGTIESVNAAETDTAVMAINGSLAPFSTSSSITVPTDGLGVAFMFSTALSATAVWSAPATISKNTTTGGIAATVSTATLLENGTPTLTSHSASGVAIVAAAWGP